MHLTFIEDNSEKEIHFAFFQKISPYLLNDPRNFKFFN